MNFFFYVKANKKGWECHVNDDLVFQFLFFVFSRNKKKTAVAMAPEGWFVT